MKRIFYILIPLLAAANVFACPLLESASAYTSHFKQTRQITGLKMPIISVGNFSLTPGKEVIWETLEPFYSKVTISEDGFKVEDKVYSEGPFKELSSILLKLHSGNLKALDKEFSYHCEMVKDLKYHLLVKPKQSELARFFKDVEVIGVTKPEQIIFIDARGDKTQVEFK